MLLRSTRLLSLTDAGEALLVRARQYPDLRLELDLVIRIGDMADSTLIGTRIATQTRVLCASPAYLAQQGAPTDLAALASHRLIDKLHGVDLLGWADVLGQPARAASQQPVFACDDFEAMRLAACEGLGIGYLPHWVVGPDIKAGLLVQLFADWSQQPCACTGIHALGALRQPPARVTVLLDALLAHIGHPPGWALEGPQR